MIICDGKKNNGSYEDLYIEDREDIMNKDYSLDEILQLIDDNALYLTNNPDSKKIVWVKEYTYTPADRRAFSLHPEYFVNSEYNGKEYAITKFFWENKLSKEELDKAFDYIYEKGINNPQYRDYLYYIINKLNIDLFDEKQFEKIEKSIDIHLLSKSFQSKFLNTLVNKYEKKEWIEEAKLYLNGAETVNIFVDRTSFFNSIDLAELKEKGIKFNESDIKQIFRKYYSDGRGELFDKIINLTKLCDDNSNYGNIILDWAMKNNSDIVYNPYQFYNSNKTKENTFPLSIILDDDSMCTILKDFYQIYSERIEQFLIDYYKDVCTFFKNNVDYQYSIIEQIIDNINNCADEKDVKKYLRDLCIYIEYLKSYNNEETIDEIKKKLRKIDYNKLVNPQFELNIASDVDNYSLFFLASSAGTTIDLIKKRRENIDNLAFHIPRDYFVGQMENIKMESVDTVYKNTIIDYLQQNHSNSYYINNVFNYFIENDIKNFYEYIYIIIRNPDIVNVLNDEQILAIYNNFDVHYENFNSSSKKYCSTEAFNNRLVNILFKDNNSNRDLLIKELTLYVNTINPEYVENENDEYNSIFEHINISEFFKQNKILLKQEEIEKILNSFNFEADINASRDYLLKNLFKFVEGIASTNTTPTLPKIIYNWMNNLEDDNFMDVLFFYNYEEYFPFLKHMDDSMKLNILKSAYLKKSKLLNNYPNLESDIHSDYITIKDFYPNYEELQTKLQDLIQYTLVDDNIEEQEKQEAEIISDFIYKMENKRKVKIKEPDEISYQNNSNLPMDDDLPF